MYIKKSKGTPLFRGPINAYIYNLVESNKLKTMRGDFIRHLGIYKNGITKYLIDYVDKDRKNKLVSIKEMLQQNYEHGCNNDHVYHFV